MHFLFLFLAIGSTAADPGWLETPPAEIFLNETVAFRAKKGYHFSEEAPQRCGTGTFLRIQQRRYLLCQFKIPGEAKPVLNVCDDAGKSCRPIAVTLKVDGGTQPAGADAALPPELALQPSSVPEFMTGSVSAVRAESRRRGQPVFVVISTEWCWPCQLAKELVFTTPEFLARTKGWFKVYIDGDIYAAREWQKLTLHDGYPTLALFNRDLELIDARFGGYREQIAEWEADVARWGDDPLHRLEQRMRERWKGTRLRWFLDFFNSKESLADDEKRFSHWVREAEVSSELKELLQRHVKPTGSRALVQRYIDLEMETAEPVGPPGAEMKELLKKLAETQPPEVRTLFYVKDLCDLDIKECPVSRVYADRFFERLAAKTTGGPPDEVDRAFTTGQAHLMFSGIFKKLGHKEEARSHARKCREGYARLQADSERWKNSHVVNQHIVFCLNAEDRPDLALAKTREMVAREPGNKNVVEGLISMLREQKKTAEALAWLDRLDATATPLERMSNRLTRAEIYIELKQRRRAKEILKSVMNEVKIAPYEGSVEQNLVSLARYHLKKL